MDTAELNNTLKQRIGDVVALLYPNAKIKGNMAHLGNIQGDAGDSFHIHVNGPRIGCFIDRANEADKGGTPLWLWSKARGITYIEAIKQAKEWLGIKDDHVSVRKFKPKIYAQPDYKGQTIKIVNELSPVMNYLINVRKLSQDVVNSNKICEVNNGISMGFPYIDKVGEKPVHMKYLDVERGQDGKKKMWATKDTKRCLFSKQTITDNDHTLVITEGEIDAMSYQTVGIPAVSVPNGVADQEWIELDWEWLERFEKIYISTDMDGVGRESAEKIARRLGLHRSYIVTLPFKDANECLQQGITKEAFIQALEASTQIDLEEIKTASQFGDAVWDLFDSKHGELGYPLPWGEFPLRIRPSEFTVVSGYSGHGKTQLLNHILIHLVSLGAKVFDASLEIKPAKTLQMMTRTAIAKKRPDSKEELDACLDWLSNSMWFYDHVGVAQKANLISAMVYARKRFGIDVFVIDSLFKCGVAGEDYNGQRGFMDELTAFVNDTGAHVILVAHSRKAQNEDEVPTKTDISGSQDINNAAFNVLVVWRNKLKQRNIDEAKEKKLPLKVAEYETWYDGRLRCDKQRFGEGEDKDMPLYFDHHSWQFWPQQYFRTPYFKYAKPS
mgnify:CR=1 FL=1